MNSLFSKYKLWDFIENWKKETVEYVSNLSPQDVIGVDQELLIQEIVTERRKQGIALDESHIECLEPIEVQIEVDRNPNLAFHNIFDPHFIKGTSVSFLIPFDGDYRFFETMPSTRNLCPPRGIIHKKQLEVVFQGDDLNPDIIDQQFQQTLSNIKEYLSWINLDLTGYNKALPLLIRPVLMQRIDKIQKDTVLISRLKYPIRPRSSCQEQTINVTPKRKIFPREQRLLGRETPLEPSIEMSEYEHILEIIKNMASVMENSPKAFQAMDEESIRQHFLVQLNGHYDGTATGETFNFNGKTDIIIKAGDRNVFIAECKFWKGKSAFSDTITQLLNYSGWRDTKTAILLFSKNRDFTSVLQQISPICHAHPNFICESPQKGETDFRFVFSHKDDSSRRLYLAVLAFNIPSAKNS